MSIPSCDQFRYQSVQRVVVGLGMAVLTTAVAFFAYLGTYARFWADDYCYSAVMMANGWWPGLVEWYLTSGNRLSSIATVSLIDLFGVRAVSALPALLLVFWLFAWCFFLQQVLKVTGWKVAKGWLIFVALIQVYFMALLAPDRYQVIYWRMGTLHYSFPLPCLLMHLGIGLWYLRTHPRVSAWFAIFFALSAFYISGHSETTAFLQAALFAIVLLISLFGLKGKSRSRSACLAAVSLGATGAMLLIMFLSPSNVNRLVDMPTPDNPLLILPYSIRYVLDYTYFSIRGQIVPYAVFACFSIAVSILILLNADIRFSSRGLLNGLGLSILIPPILMVASFLPSAYANLQYPGPRALTPGSSILLAWIALLAFWISVIGLRLLSQATLTWVGWAALVLALAASLYPIRSLNSLLVERNTLATWAERWDGRDREIRYAIAAGAQDLTVREFEVVHNLEDLGPNPHHWVNNCAAIYYGVESITAVP